MAALFRISDHRLVEVFPQWGIVLTRLVTVLLRLDDTHSILMPVIYSLGVSHSSPGQTTRCAFFHRVKRIVVTFSLIVAGLARVSCLVELNGRMNSSRRATLLFVMFLGSVQGCVEIHFSGALEHEVLSFAVVCGILGIYAKLVEGYFNSLLMLLRI